MKTLIKNGRVVDPANKIDGVSDILIENTKISKLAKDLSDKADEVIDAEGKIVMPGLVDMHVHLREPGREDKETIASGTRSALAGGVTSVLAMPNTTPAIDSEETVRLLKNIIEKTALTNVYIAGAITKGRLGSELTELAKLRKEGVIAISDDGSSIDDEKLMLEALRVAKKTGLLTICHCEDKSLSHNGVVNQGVISTKLGLRGIPKESEYKRIQRDIQLAQKAQARIHIAHVSCLESIEIIAQAKKKGIQVTAETAPHYFALSEEAVCGYDTNKKMNPPLRAKEDITAIIRGLKDGTLDAIASDHAPHTENEKEVEFDYAEFGVVGLETELAVAITELVNTGLLDWSALVEKFSLNPAKILGIHRGTLSVGNEADIVIVSPEKKWLIRKEAFVSKSKNSAFLGKNLAGVVEYTILAGKIVYRNP